MRESEWKLKKMLGEGSTKKAIQLSPKNNENMHGVFAKLIGIHGESNETMCVGGSPGC